MVSEKQTRLVEQVMTAFADSVVDGKLSLAKLVKRMKPYLEQKAISGKQSKGATRRILVIRLEEIGDLVLGSAFLRELRRNQPFAHITLLVKPACYEVVAFCPYVNEVLTINTWVRGADRNVWQIMYDVVHFAVGVLWNASYDICLVPRYDDDYYWAGLLALLSRSPQRIGFSENATPWKAQWNRGFDSFYTRVLPAVSVIHEVERNLSMIASLGGKVVSRHIEFWTTRADEVWAEQFAQQRLAPKVAVALGRPNDCRHWPMENYVDILNWLAVRYGMTAILFGSQEEVALSAELAERLDGKVVDCCGKTSLRQAAALLRHCSFYLGRDTGIMHIAAAVGKPVLEVSPHNLLGDPQFFTSCERYSPWGVPHRIIRPEVGLDSCEDGCFAAEPHCIQQIGVAQVKQGLEILFAEAGINEWVPFDEVVI